LSDLGALVDRGLRRLGIEPRGSTPLSLTSGADWARPVWTGVEVNQSAAMSVSAVYAAVRVLATSVATLPFHVYRQVDQRRERADHPLNKLLGRKPNRLMTPVELLSTTMVHLLLRGNAYWQVIRDNSGEPLELFPLHPDRVTVDLDTESMRLTYSYQPTTGDKRRFADGEVVHFRGLSGDGIMGYSVLQQARQSLGLTIALEEFGARRFGNDARPSGVLQSDQVIDRDAKAELRAAWEAIHGGVANASRVAIMDAGLKFAPIGMTNEDAQFITSREFQIVEVARWFGVPVHKLYDMRRQTFNNIEHMAIEFVQDSIRPWLEVIESRIDADLLEEPFYVKGNVSALLRGDTASRFNSYRVGREIGMYSVNDLLALEDQNPVENGDMYVMPLNWVDVGNVADGSTTLRPRVSALKTLMDEGFDDQEALAVVGLPPITKRYAPIAALGKGGGSAAVNRVEEGDTDVQPDDEQEVPL
jgi:HK97 family phage portal protein